MFGLLQIWIGILVRLLRSRQTLMLENLALRQQLVVLKRHRTGPDLPL